MMSFAVWRKILAFPLLLVALLLFVQHLGTYIPLKPFHYSEQTASGFIEIYIDDTAITTGECTELKWDAEGIQSVFLAVHGVTNGVIGHDKRSFCADGSLHAYPLGLTFTLQNGEQRSIETEIRILFFNPISSELALFCVGLLVLMGPTPRPQLREIRRLLPLALFPLSLAAAFGLLLLLDQVVSAPFMVNFVTHAMYDSLATDADRCGFDHFNLDAAPFSIQPERVLFHDIPALPAREKRIIFIGLSNASESFLWPELPAALRQRLFNLSVGAASPLEHEAILDYLQSQKGTLTPADGKSAVVLLYWHGIFAINPPHSGWQKVFTQYEQLNLEVVSPVKWELTPTHNPAGVFSLANARLSAMLFEHLPRALRATFQPDPAYVGGLAATCHPTGSTYQQLQDEARSFWESYYGSAEDYVLPNQPTESLESMANLIRETGTPLIVVHMPVSSGFREMIFQERYLHYMAAFAEAYDAPVYDLSELVADEGYRDNIHLTIAGRRQLQAKLFEILVQEGLLTESDLAQ